MRNAFHTTDALADRLTDLCVRYPEVEPEMVAEVLRAVLDTLSGQLSEQETSLLREVELLGRTITAARADLSALHTDEISIENIGAAGSELAAVVSHTAAATDAIIDACEVLDQEAGRWPGETAVALQAATTQIYEACSFQDITGQRLAKVVGTLRAVENQSGPDCGSVRAPALGRPARQRRTFRQSCSAQRPATAGRCLGSSRN